MKLLQRIQRFKPKRIYVFENGYTDSFIDHSVTINPKTNRTWDSILYYITQSIKPHFSHVERLVRRRNCTSVHSFSELEANEKYIACGKPYARVIPGSYRTRSEIRIKGTPNEGPEMSPNRDWTLEQARKNKRKIIFMFANGRKKQVPIKFVLTGRDFANWKATLNYMSIMLDMPKGIYNIYTTYGKQIFDPLDLQHGASYVASSFNDKFEDLEYLENYEKYLTEKFQNVDKAGDKGENNQNNNQSLDPQDVNLTPSVHVVKKKRNNKRQKKKDSRNLQERKPKSKFQEEMEHHEPPIHHQVSSEENIPAKPASKNKSKRKNISTEKNITRSKSSQSANTNKNDLNVERKRNNLYTSNDNVMIIDNLNESHYADVSVQTIPKSLHSFEAAPV